MPIRPLGSGLVAYPLVPLFKLYISSFISKPKKLYKWARPPGAAAIKLQIMRLTSCQKPPSDEHIKMNYLCPFESPLLSWSSKIAANDDDHFKNLQTNWYAYTTSQASVQQLHPPPSRSHWTWSPQLQTTWTSSASGWLCESIIKVILLISIVFRFLCTLRWSSFLLPGLVKSG